MPNYLFIGGAAHGQQLDVAVEHDSGQWSLSLRDVPHAFRPESLGLAPLPSAMLYSKRTVRVGNGVVCWVYALLTLADDDVARMVEVAPAVSRLAMQTAGA